MNKKGFTLVELLAVIAILAILVIIAMPSVLDLFNGAKQSTFKVELQNVIDAAQTQFVKDAMSSNAANYTYGNIGTTTDVANSAKSYSIKLDSAGNVVCLNMSDASFSYNKTATTSPYITKTNIAETDIIANGQTGYTAATACN